MLFRTLALVCLVLAFAGRAEACRYLPRPFEEQLKNANQVFYGTVMRVEDGLTILKVDKAVRGVKDGQEVEVPNEGSSCDIRFTAGQRWFFMGGALPSGSALLADENGNEIAENMDMIAENTGDPAARGGMVIGGTLERSCAPWDGAAYMITLDNGIVAHVYDSIVERDSPATAVFPADGKSERGHGQILSCLKDKPCAPLSGTITMGAVDSSMARGRIDVKDGEHSTRHVFKVKRVTKQVFCG